MRDSCANTLLWLLMIVSIASLAETSCYLVWTTNSVLNQYNDSSNLTLTTDCSHAEFTYYSFKLERWRPLNEFEPAADQSISYTNHSTNRKRVDINTNKCVYHINIQMTEEKHEHLQGVVFIRSRDPGYNYCYPLPQRYIISTSQSKCKCNCNQEPTTGQTTAADQETTEQTTTTVSAEETNEQTTTTASAKGTTEQTTATASAEGTTKQTTATASAEGTIDQTTATASAEETVDQTAATAYLDQDTNSSSCKIIVERMLLLFCSLICFFVITLNTL